MLNCTPLPTRYPAKNSLCLLISVLRRWWHSHCVVSGKFEFSEENLDSKNLRRKEENFMAKGFFLWLLGIPFGLIVVLWLFGFLT